MYLAGTNGRGQPVSNQRIHLEADLSVRDEAVISSSLSDRTEPLQEKSYETSHCPGSCCRRCRTDEFNGLGKGRSQSRSVLRSEFWFLVRNLLPPELQLRLQQQLLPPELRLRSQQLLPTELWPLALLTAWIQHHVWLWA